MKPVCAVTGASGYVGSRIAAALAAEFEVLAMSRNAGEGGLRWSMGQEASVVEALRAREVSALVHSAWDFGQPRPTANWKSNVQGSGRLLEQARAAGVQTPVFVSTISAFEGAQSEYGKSKLAVETMFLEAGGTVIRPGLVWGDRPGGVFGSLRRQVSKGGRVPVIGDGRYAQYLVHEDDLAGVLVRAVRGEFPGRRLTVAHPQPWLLRDLILRIAIGQGKSVKLVEVPWRLIWAGLKTAEMLGLKPGFRSDSVVSLVHQNPAPEFSDCGPVRAFQ